MPKSSRNSEKQIDCLPPKTDTHRRFRTRSRILESVRIFYKSYIIFDFYYIFVRMFYIYLYIYILYIYYINGTEDPGYIGKALSPMVVSPPPWATNSPKVLTFQDWRATFGRSQNHTKMGISKNLPESNKSNSWAPVAPIWEPLGWCFGSIFRPILWSSKIS